MISTDIVIQSDGDIFKAFYFILMYVIEQCNGKNDLITTLLQIIISTILSYKSCIIVAVESCVILSYYISIFLVMHKFILIQIQKFLIFKISIENRKQRLKKTVLFNGFGKFPYLEFLYFSIYIYNIIVVLMGRHSQQSKTVKQPSLSALKFNNAICRPKTSKWDIQVDYIHCSLALTLNECFFLLL
ncbi:Hypothetical_protein [Hexamita inflata]|uniref:Hypothetical_protein n=1 Tax=Hexamita inflata TaxID=28002 RepID=A0AA86RB17_9EUKA|nr:Hypothetical protein HINF_LOCUS57188 [Hexamita inflata]